MADEENEFSAPIPLKDLPKPNSVAAAIKIMADALTPHERRYISEEENHDARLAHISLTWPSLDAGKIMDGLIAQVKADLANAV